MIKLTDIIVISVISFFSSNIGLTQQGKIWYFGDHAGLDFNNGNPVPLDNGATYNDSYPHSEGTSSISDFSGNLLFYSNGQKVWNRNHQIMSNGDSLLGHLSSTQSSIIVPLPNSSRYYYLFTTDAYWQSELKNGFRYSVIDMCLDQGYGDVTDEKNIRLVDTVAEKLTAVRHSNGTDYWVITHKFNSDAFYAFLLTENGISDTVITHVGSVHMEYCSGSTSPYKSAIGQLKASPNGHKIACVNGQTCVKISELFDFDPTTGILSNVIDLQADSIAGYFYGLSFSADNSKLYLTASVNHERIYQFDISSGDANQIRASKFVVASNPMSPWFSALQLGPDGKIYVALRNSSYLGVINEPEIAGSGCDFVELGINLSNGTCSYGLPNFIDSYSYTNDDESCNELSLFSEESELFSLYPNPMDRNVNIESSVPLKDVTISIYDVFGRVLKLQEFKEGNVFALDLEDLCSGTFYLELKQEAELLKTFKIELVR